jgi:hypothetical protein
MTERVKIDSTAASPFRVSSAGAAVDTAEFNTLIFDGNQSPMRLWATGYILVTGISDADFIGGKNVNVDHTGSFPTPTGTTPVFITVWRRDGDPTGSVITPFFGSRSGAGGGVCSGTFVGANFHAAASGVGGPGASAYTNYCIFKNHN